MSDAAPLPSTAAAPAGITVGDDVSYSILITGDYNRVYLTPAEATVLPEVRRRLRILTVIAAPGLYRAVGDRLGEANVYLSLGRLSLGRGELRDAMVPLEQAAHLYEEIGAQAGLANVSITLARLAAVQRDFCTAVERIQPAIDFARRIGHPLAEALEAEQAAWGRQTGC
ncbi:MAG: hypothetical protein SWK90_00260 [Chloroflexota bacterium]|nr:hypothetical protein [Chloroflexota bacterium]